MASTITKKTYEKYELYHYEKDGETITAIPLYNHTYPWMTSFSNAYNIPIQNIKSAYREFSDCQYSMGSSETKKANLTIPADGTNGYINGITLPYYWSQLYRIDMAVQDLNNTNNWMWFAVWTGSSVTGTWLSHNQQSGFSVHSRTSISNRTLMNDVTVKFTCSNSSQYAHLFSWNEGGWSRRMNVQYVRVYDRNEKLIMYLIPFYRDSVYGMLDLFTLSFYKNSGNGTLLYSFTE